MAAEASRESPDLDPVVRAVVEARAQQSGLSISDYLAQLILTPHHGQSAAHVHMGSWATSLVPENSRDLDIWKSTSGNIVSADRGRLILHEDIAADLSKPAPRVSPWGSTTFVSPAHHLVTVFNDRIHGAALLMSAAFLEAAVSDFRPPPTRYGSTRRRHPPLSWYEQVVTTCLVRSREVRNALVHRWLPTKRAEGLAIDAFVLLTDLTPARTELLQLCRYDRPRAFSELAKHLDLLTDQFRLSAHLLAEVEAAERPAALTEGQRFADISATLLERAGGGVSLTEGAKLLGTTRQALHKRIKAGSALGMMLGSELVLPQIQFVTTEGKTRLVGGLSRVVRLFEASKAGGWSALQFLIEPDPNLEAPPIRALSEGRIDAAVNAARAYLGADEE